MWRMTWQASSARPYPPRPGVPVPPTAVRGCGSGDCGTEPVPVRVGGDLRLSRKCLIFGTNTVQEGH